MIAATQWEIAHGSSPGIVKLAQQALPVLRAHLAMMKTGTAAG